MNLQTIVASKGVKKLGPKEGRTKLVAGVRLTWKATGEDTGYATSFYEMDLPPGKGIPLHSHPYAEVFYVVSGHTDFLRVDDAGKEEWVRCGPGDTVVAPINALHEFHNRTDAPSRFISSSVYYHEVFFETRRNWFEGSQVSKARPGAPFDFTPRYCRGHKLCHFSFRMSLVLWPTAALHL